MPNIGGVEPSDEVDRAALARAAPSNNKKVCR